jgi:hypothetical protein
LPKYCPEAKAKVWWSWGFMDRRCSAEIPIKALRTSSDEKAIWGISTSHYVWSVKFISEGTQSQKLVRLNIPWGSSTLGDAGNCSGNYSMKHREHRQLTRERGNIGTVLTMCRPHVDLV